MGRERSSKPPAGSHLRSSASRFYLTLSVFIVVYSVLICQCKIILSKNKTTSICNFVHDDVVTYKQSNEEECSLYSITN